MELIVAAIIILAILSLGSGMFGRWIRAGGEGGVLLVDLHSLSEADYSVDAVPRSVPAIGLEIIQDLLGVSDPLEDEGPFGVAVITPASPLSTATLAYYGELPGTTAPTNNFPENATATHESRMTATYTSTPLFAPTSTVNPTTIKTQPPTATLRPSNTPEPPGTPPGMATATSTNIVPSATQPIIPSKTPLPSPLPAPTQTPNPSPTPQPVNSPTPRPTRSSTLAVTPTAQYTPAPGYPPPFP